MKNQKLTEQGRTNVRELAKRGLLGRAVRAAMSENLTLNQIIEILNERDFKQALLNLFVWKRSKEDHHYWYNIVFQTK